MPQALLHELQRPFGLASLAAGRESHVEGHEVRRLLRFRHDTKQMDRGPATRASD